VGNERESRACGRDRDGIGHEYPHPGVLCAMPQCPGYAGRGAEEPSR
jgi:hypothetical protein